VRCARRTPIGTRRCSPFNAVNTHWMNEVVVSCRAVIGSVAGVRLEQVHLASVAYAAAAAAGRRMLADGYHTLQVMILGMVLGLRNRCSPMD